MSKRNFTHFFQNTFSMVFLFYDGPVSECISKLSFDQWFHDPKVHDPTFRFETGKQISSFIRPQALVLLTGLVALIPILLADAPATSTAPILIIEFDASTPAHFSRRKRVPENQKNNRLQTLGADASAIAYRKFRSAHRWRKRGHCSANLKRCASSVLSRCTIK